MNYNLGYACINTLLRKKDVFMSRTCRLETMLRKGHDYVKDLSIKNLLDLKLILQYNIYNDIYLFRLSSEIFPFASHSDYGYDISYAKDILKEIGDYAKMNKIRLTFHPGQYNVLSSINETIIENTTRDLVLHAKILDLMGLDNNSVIVVHAGGVYNNKKEALYRIENNINNLPVSVKNRLVLENCEMCYCVEDLLPISKKLLIPIVVDFHHDEIYRSSEDIEFYLNEIFEIWDKRGIKPKVHISNSVPGINELDNKTKRRKHSDLIYRLHTGLLSIKRPVDVMVEAKGKELALFSTRKLIKELKK